MRRIAMLAVTAAASAAFLIATATSTASGTLPVLTITMNGKSITVGGSLQSGAVNVVSTTTNEVSGSPMLFRLNPGVTAAQALAAAAASGGDLNKLNAFGAIVFNAEADRGTSAVQTTLLPGNYVAIDTTNNNPAKQPTTTFTITPAATPATLPTPNATVRAIDFRFRGPGTLHDGQIVRFQNDGDLVHMIIGIRARNLRSARQIVRLLLAGRDNRAQRLATGFFGFAGPLSSNQGQQMTLSVRAGTWVLACFMDAQDGREHTQLGMERVITIRRS